MGLQNRYTVQVSPLNETMLQQQLSKDDPIAYTKALAEQKAWAMVPFIVGEEDHHHDDSNHNHTTTPASVCPNHHHHYTIILAADTIVVCGDNIMEKPTSPEDAIRMLTQLSQNVHKVHTAVAILMVSTPRSSSRSSVVPSSVSTPPNDSTNHHHNNNNDPQKNDDDDDDAFTNDHHRRSSTIMTTSFVDTAQVKFASISSTDIEAYVASGEPMDKAGSYGIQGLGGQLIESMTGDFFTVRTNDTHVKCEKGTLSHPTLRWMRSFCCVLSCR
jgi:predicted house-cleaning NTP pyrophosphatase (Maf/HAM1 superfamily)